MLYGVDDVGYSDVGMEVGVIGYFGFFYVGVVVDGIDVVVVFYLEIFVYF